MYVEDPMLVRRQWTVLAAIIGAGVSGCISDTTTEAVPASIVGTWTGSVLLPDASPATMKLQQRGNAVTGEMAVSTLFPQGRALTGQVDTAARTFVWAVDFDCEAWSGTLTISPDAQAMEGSLQIVRSACPPAQAALGESTGTLSLTK
jgi:hypothetical protein